MLYEELIQSVEDDMQYFKEQGFDVLAEKFKIIHDALVTLTDSSSLQVS